MMTEEDFTVLNRPEGAGIKKGGWPDDRRKIRIGGRKNPGDEE